MGCAHDGESATRSPGIHFRRIDEGHIDGLAGPEGKSGGLVEDERERVPRNNLALSQRHRLHLMGRHAASPVRDRGAHQAPLARAPGALAMRANAEWLWMDSKFSDSTV